jgi:mannose-6-phosphate isomerase-like protein (cupin superfamily)
MKGLIFAEVKSQLESKGLEVESKDENRPWGGFFVINENQAQEFSNAFLNGLDVSLLRISGKLSPKLLLVEPHKRLSWQYHHRRAEIWRVIKGSVGIIRSDSDMQGDLIHLNTFDQVTLKQGERHRLIGLDDWAVIAEIWQHTDLENPSNEDDIVRLQDDFGR